MAATTKITTPSYYHGQNYDNYKKEVGFWEAITNVEAKNRGLHLLLNLPGRDKESMPKFGPHEIIIGSMWCRGGTGV